MIPLRDINPRSTFPVVTLLLIAANVLVFLFQLSLGPETGMRFAFAYGMIPARVQVALGGGQAGLAQAVAPLATSIFLHGGFLHLIGNMWFLWVFGDNVEDRLGHLRYLVFYLLTGVGAGIVHTVFNWDSTVPAVGASGAISGVMGAYAVLFPRSRVVTLVPLVIWCFWIGIFPKPYFEVLEKPVALLVQRVETQGATPPLAVALPTAETAASETAAGER